jgi:teichuronic acid biosynthesis glycosyltransferase TuaH
MKSSRCIIILGATRFDAQYESTSYNLAKEFAKTHTVYYIEYPFTIADKLKPKNKHQFQLRKAAIAGENEGVIGSGTANLNIVILPPLLSVHFLPEGRLYRKLLAYNEQLIARRLNRIIKTHSLNNIVYINSFVFHYPNLSDFIKPRLSIYHCVDPIITSYDLKHGLVSEKILISKSDLIICTSQQLYREKSRLHSSTHFVPNAADIHHSIKATNTSLAVHQALEKIPKPIVGYFGNIESRIDFELMRDVANTNKDIHFVFAGPIEKHLVPDFFYTIPNIHFTGRIAYDQMPNMLKGFSVAIIPFKRTDESSTVFPLKLFEYLGAAKPVVATDFNLDLQKITGDLVSYCNTVDQFSNAVKNALMTDSAQLQSRRIELAKQHTWAKRVLDISNLIENKQKKQEAV